MTARTFYFLIQEKLKIPVHVELGHAVGRGQFKESFVFDGYGGLNGKAYGEFPDVPA